MYAKLKSEDFVISESGDAIFEITVSPGTYRVRITNSSVYHLATQTFKAIIECKNANIHVSKDDISVLEPWKFTFSAVDDHEVEFFISVKIYGTKGMKASISVSQVYTIVHKYKVDPNEEKSVETVLNTGIYFIRVEPESVKRENENVWWIKYRITNILNRTKTHLKGVKNMKRFIVYSRDSPVKLIITIGFHNKILKKMEYNVLVCRVVGDDVLSQIERNEQEILVLHLESIIQKSIQKRDLKRLYAIVDMCNNDPDLESVCKNTLTLIDKLNREIEAENLLKTSMETRNIEQIQKAIKASEKIEGINHIREEAVELIAEIEREAIFEEKIQKLLSDHYQLSKKNISLLQIQQMQREKKQLLEQIACLEDFKSHYFFLLELWYKCQLAKLTRDDNELKKLEYNCMKFKHEILREDVKGNPLQLKNDQLLRSYDHKTPSTKQVQLFGEIVSYCLHLIKE